MDTMAVKMLSIVIPFKNEIETLPELFRRLHDALASAPNMDFEIVLVDDASDDGSDRHAIEFVENTPNAVYLRLVQNKGSHVAATVGLNHCSGECAIIMAADLQDPPSLIPRMLEEWRCGSPVVWAERSARPGESVVTRTSSALYYRLIHVLGVPNVSSSGADVLLLDRAVINAFNQLDERNSSILALVAWLGFPQTVIQYEKSARSRGQSKWTFWMKIKLVIDTVVAFSYVPIRLISALGLMVSAFGFLYAAHIIYNAFQGNPTEGWSSIMVVVLVIGGLQLLILGMLGEYVWRALDEARSRPRYVIQKCLGNNSRVRSNAVFDQFGNKYARHETSQ
jgi:polyisoprenyl-phosphate glycosyltransferase